MKTERHIPTPPPATSADELMTDPVCGMTVDPRGTLGAGYDGRIFHFCSESCRARFLAAPEDYIREQPPPAGSELSPSRPSTGSSPAPAENNRKNPAHRTNPAGSWTSYIPLMIVIGLSLASAWAKQNAYPGPGDMRSGMHDFMGLFLVIFSMFKLFDLRGFADGFQMYDLLAKPFRPYAYIYPFIELSLGLGYLAAWNLPVVYGATIAVMLFGALGVVRALRKGLDLHCACMDTVLKVPLSTVALTEDLGMAAMAGIMRATA